LDAARFFKTIGGERINKGWITLPLQSKISQDKGLGRKQTNNSSFKINLKTPYCTSCSRGKNWTIKAPLLRFLWFYLEGSPLSYQLPPVNCIGNKKIIHGDLLLVLSDDWNEYVNGFQNADLSFISFIICVTCFKL